MNQPPHSKFHRVLCVALVVLLVAAVVGAPESFATTKDIEDAAVPTAASIYTSSEESAGDGGCSADEYLVDAEETSLAQEERSSNPEELGYIPGELIVVYEESASESERRAAIKIVEGEESAAEASFEGGAVVPVEISDDVTVDTAAEMVKREPAVKYALPNYTVSTFDEPSPVAQGAASFKADDRRANQWYIDYVKAPAAWEILEANVPSLTPTRVAIIDTGASLDHPDLSNVVNREQSIEVIHGEDSDLSSWKWQSLRGDGYVNGSAGVEEFSSHGTHVSGIVAAEAGNGGILGVASGGVTTRANSIADLVVIDAFSKKSWDSRSGTWTANGTVYDVIFALGYARDVGCKVVNMSLGFDVYDEDLAQCFEELCCELTDKNDMLIVAAAGNSGVNRKSIPASCESVIGVISLTHWANANPNRGSVSSASWITGEVTRSSFSNYGDWCDLSAPGEYIYSTLLVNGSSNTYGRMDGTSMACPVVTAVASMVRAAAPDLTAKEVRDILCKTATDLTDVCGKDDQSGWGAVDAEAALREVLPLSLEPESPRADSADLAQPPMPSDSTSPPVASQQPIAEPTPQVPDSSLTARKGWKTVGGKWRYLKPDGSYATGWLKVGGAWYYLHSNGDMATGWLKTGKTWYYLKDSGAMATGWLKTGKSWYYLKGSGAMATGWFCVGKTWYYSNGSGAMQANRWIGNYYVKSSGAMATNQWVGRYHVDTSGKWDKTR